jgi:CBS domain-containing protein
MSIQTVLDHKGTGVVTVAATETLRGAANRMQMHRIAALVVKGGDTISGLISERDIVHAISQHGERALSMAVREVMSHAIVMVAPTDRTLRAMRLMTDHRVQHLPVMDGSRLAGIVSIGDVVKHRLNDLETESNVLRDAYIAAH